MFFRRLNGNCQIRLFCRNILVVFGLFAVVVQAADITQAVHLSVCWHDNDHEDHDRSHDEDRHDCSECPFCKHLGNWQESLVVEAVASFVEVPFFSGLVFSTAQYNYDQHKHEPLIPRGPPSLA